MYKRQDLDLVLDFCKEEWIDTYVKGLFLNGGNKIPEFPQFKYIAQYIFFIHYLQKSNQLPKIKLFSDKVDSFINIDFVLDIGTVSYTHLMQTSLLYRKWSPNIRAVRRLSPVSSTYSTAKAAPGTTE